MDSPTTGRSVPVCLRCGHRDIRVQSAQDGLFPGGGEGMAWTCDRCGYQGAPLLVDPDEDADDDARWAAEVERAERDVVGESAAPATRRPIYAAVLFLVAGLFLLPVGLLLAITVGSGEPFQVVTGVAGSGLFVLLAVALARAGLAHLGLGRVEESS